MFVQQKSTQNDINTINKYYSIPCELQLSIIIRTCRRNSCFPEASCNLRRLILCRTYEQTGSFLLARRVTGKVKPEATSVGPLYSPHRNLKELSSNLLPRNMHVLTSPTTTASDTVFPSNLAVIPLKIQLDAGEIIINAGGIPLLNPTETHEEALVSGDATTLTSTPDRTLDHRNLSELDALPVFDTLERRINSPDRVATHRIYDNARSLLERRSPDRGRVQHLQHLDDWSLNTLFAVPWHAGLYFRALSSAGESFVSQKQYLSGSSERVYQVGEIWHDWVRGPKRGQGYLATMGNLYRAMASL